MVLFLISTVFRGVAHIKEEVLIVTSVTREIYDLTKLMTLQYIKDRYKKMSGSKTVLLKYFFNRFISSVDINTLSTYQIEHIFS